MPRTDARLFHPAAPPAPSVKPAAFAGKARHATHACWTRCLRGRRRVLFDQTSSRTSKVSQSAGACTLARLMRDECPPVASHPQSSGASTWPHEESTAFGRAAWNKDEAEHASAQKTLLAPFSGETLVE